MRTHQIPTLGLSALAINRRLLFHARCASLVHGINGGVACQVVLTVKLDGDHIGCAVRCPRDSVLQAARPALWVRGVRIFVWVRSVAVIIGGATATRRYGAAFAAHGYAASTTGELRKCYK